MITKSLDAINRKEAAKLSLKQLADPEYSIFSDMWDLCDDVFAGELRVKAKDDKYIYKPKSKTGASRKQAWEAYKGTRGTKVQTCLLKSSESPTFLNFGWLLCE